MKPDEFRHSLRGSAPPAGCGPVLQSLWYDGKGNWNAAHEIAQEIDTPDGAWVHAYLHRKEGDVWNADYWYRRAGRTCPDHSLEEEWALLVENFLPGR